MNAKPDPENSISDSVNNIRLTDVLDLNDIQTMQDLFSDATGVASVITNPEGIPITIPSNFCRLCKKIIRKTKEGVSDCINPQCSALGSCLASALWHADARITLGDKHIANWIIAEIRNNELDKDRVIQCADEIGVDREVFVKVLNEIPVMTVQQFGKVSKMMYALANELSEKAYKNLQLEKKFAEWEQANKLLRESKDQYYGLYMNMNEGAALHELIYNKQGVPQDYVIIETNHAFEIQLGLSRNAVIGKTSREAYGVSEPPKLEVYAQVAMTGEPTVFEMYFPPMSKYFSISVYCPEKGRFATIFDDITERKLTEEVLRKSEEKYRLLIENTHDIFYTTDTDGMFTYVSPAWITLLGHQIDQVVGKNVRSFIHPDDVGKCMEILQKMIITRQRQTDIEYRVQHIDGTWRWHSSNMSPLIDEDGTLIGSYGLARDTTDRKSVENVLREKEVQYRALADSGLALIWTSGLDKLCNYFNKPWFEFTGRTLEQEMGNGWAEGVHPMDFDQCVQTYVTAFDKRESFAMEYRLLHVSGEYRWLLDKGTPNYNINGDFVGYIGHCFDITELKQAEAEVKQKNKELQELIAEKDKLFSIIAHDLRSPFNTLLGLSQIMAEELPKLTMSEMQRIAGSMRNSAINLFHLLENLLHWARMQQGLISFNPEVLQLFSLVDECITMELEFAKSKKIEISVDIPTGLTVFADSNILQTIIRNFISNSIKFTRKGGKINLSAKLKDEKSVEISISDSGIGMSRTMIDNLFQIDVQVNRKGTQGEPSSGLGLLLCKEFIAKHGGKIWVDSEEGKGTTFYFTMPCDAN